MTNATNQAIDPALSSWIFASAGSGKTTILTNRILRLLLDDVLPNKILCLTYTKAGASEMQSRINSKLSELVLCSDEELEQRLKALDDLTPSKNRKEKTRSLLVKTLDSDAKIKIQTIHSFCQSLIKIFPLEAKVKPNFNLIEGNQEKLLLKQAQKEVLKNAQKDEKLRKIIFEIGGIISDKSLLDVLSKLLAKKEDLIFLREKFFGIDGVINKIFENFSLQESQKAEEIFEDFLQEIDLKKLSELAAELENSKLKGNIKLSSQLKLIINNKLQLESFSQLKKLFFTKENEPYAFNKEINDSFVLGSIVNDSSLILSKFDDKFKSLKIAQNTALLLRFIDRILEKYEELKRQNSFLDYNDLIIHTNALLASPDFSHFVKMKMDGSFDHILIDESQDTNHRQWSIIKALCEDFAFDQRADEKKRSIFVVGDEKQSIYSFQGAQPNISAEVFDEFQNRSDGKIKKIELNNSFRSLPEILAAVDAVFLPKERSEAISKAAPFKHHNAIRQGIGKFEIWPQIKFEREKKGEKNYQWEFSFELDEEQKEAQIMAQNVAVKIATWVGEKRILTKRARPVEYGDFMILLRTRKNGFAQFLHQELLNKNIPFCDPSKTSLSGNLLTCDLLAAAKFATLPQDDFNLACLLKSVFFSLSEEDLLEICAKKNEEQTSIFNVLQDFTKFVKIKNQLEKIGKAAKELNAFEFFYFLLSSEGLQKKLVLEFGSEALEIADKFLIFVQNFCANFSKDLSKFLSFIAKVDPEISLSADNKNCVKISTIHSAKGLQAPVVLIPDCAYDFNKLPSLKDEILFFDFAEEKIPLWCQTKAQENFFVKNHKKQRAKEVEDEYLRLLYVAMTRAEDELYIAGFGKSKDAKSWFEIVKNSLPNSFNAEAFLMEVAPEKIEQKTAEKVATEIDLLAAFQPTDSGFENQINKAQIRGKLIHKILEIFGKNSNREKSWLQNLAQKIIEKESLLSETEKNQISALALQFLASDLFEELFSNLCHFEIEIAAKEKLLRIDLLVEKENEVLVIDYKSDESTPNELLQQYVLQLEKYKSALQEIYPQKNISGAVLYLNDLRLVAV